VLADTARGRRSAREPRHFDAMKLHDVSVLNVAVTPVTPLRSSIRKA